MFDKRTAILADVHANLSALEAVLEDSEKHGIEEFFFLGDIVGYGPKPNECIALLRDYCKCTFRLLGNHDYAFLNNADYFGLHARHVIEWTQKAVSPSNREWVATLCERGKSESYLLVHGSPRDATDEYLLHDVSANNRLQLEENFGLISGLCLNGHTHIPGCFSCVSEHAQYHWAFPSELGDEVNLDEKARIVNVGSVGQPRDKDPRASYAIAHESKIIWRRVRYDIDRTIRDIATVPAIHEVLGQRLLQGR